MTATTAQRKGLSAFFSQPIPRQGKHPPADRTAASSQCAGPLGHQWQVFTIATRPDGRKIQEQRCLVCGAVR